MGEAVFSEEETESVSESASDPTIQKAGSITEVQQIIADWADTKVYNYYGNPNTKGMVGPKFVSEMCDILEDYEHDVMQNFCTEGAVIVLYHALSDAGLTKEELRSILPLVFDADTARIWAVNKGLWHQRTKNGFGGYTPKTGDLLIFRTKKEKTKAVHTEIFRWTQDGSYVSTNLNEGGVIVSTVMHSTKNSQNSKRRKIMGIIEIPYGQFFQ